MTKILIHGLGQDSSSWDKTISLLKEDKVMSPNLVELLNGKEVTYTNLYKCFSEYCENVSQPLDLCGLSLGGMLALNYAIDNPTKVKSLVLVATQYKMPKTLLKLQNIIFKFMPNSSFSSMGMSKEDFINLTRTMMDLNFEEKLRNIKCPVLIICGTKDTPNKKASVNLSNYISKSQIQFIKNAKHEVNTDSPKELAELINEFYKQDVVSK